MANKFEKYAHDLALAAATGRRASLVTLAHPFIKSANPTLSELLKDPTVQRYLIGGLGGAGLGAIIGSLQPGRRARKALNYGVMGGLGGLGLAHLLGSSVFNGTGTPDTKTPAAQGPVGQAVNEVINTAPHVPQAAVTPYSELPAIQENITGGTVPGVDAAARAFDQAIRNDPLLAKSTPAAMAGFGVAGAAAGNYAGRRLSTAATNYADRSTAQAVRSFNAKPSHGGFLGGAGNKPIITPQELTDNALRQQIRGDARTKYPKDIVFGSDRNADLRQSYFSNELAAQQKRRADLTRAREFDANQLKFRNTGFRRGLGLLGLGIRLGAPLAGLFGGMRAPAAVTDVVTDNW